MSIHGDSFDRAQRQYDNQLPPEGDEARYERSEEQRQEKPGSNIDDFLKGKIEE